MRLDGEQIAEVRAIVREELHRQGLITADDLSPFEDAYMAAKQMAWDMRALSEKIPPSTVAAAIKADAGQLLRELDEMANHRRDEQ